MWVHNVCWAVCVARSPTIDGGSVQYYADTPDLTIWDASLVVVGIIDNAIAGRPLMHGISDIRLRRPPGFHSPAEILSISKEFSEKLKRMAVPAKALQMLQRIKLTFSLDVR